LEPSGHIDPQVWMTRPETRAVMAALAAGGRPARFVGGCVRDALLGRPVSDVDIATEEPPERVVELLESAGLKALPTGIAHGTVTAIAGRIPHEVTTLRHDIVSDGRHATVAFTDDWAADAARRDFTFNALYADDDGTLYDPVGGVVDARAGRVRFVGDARTRISAFMRITGEPGRMPRRSPPVARWRRSCRPSRLSASGLNCAV
jgi:poly(A) polymerase